MLKIKLARIGKKGQPQYRIVVIEDKTKSGTRSVEQIGFYNPLTADKEVRLDTVAYDAWLVKGARPTPTVMSLARRLVSPTKAPTAKPTSKPTVKPSKIIKKSK